MKEEENRRVKAGEVKSTFAHYAHECTYPLPPSRCKALALLALLRLLTLLALHAHAQLTVVVAPVALAVGATLGGNLHGGTGDAGVLVVETHHRLDGVDDPTTLVPVQLPATTKGLLDGTTLLDGQAGAPVLEQARLADLPADELQLAEVEALEGGQLGSGRDVRLGERLVGPQVVLLQQLHDLLGGVGDRGVGHVDDGRRVAVLAEPGGVELRQLDGGDDAHFAMSFFPRLLGACHMTML